MFDIVVRPRLSWSLALIALGLLLALAACDGSSTDSRESSAASAVVATSTSAGAQSAFPLGFPLAGAT